MAASQDSDLYGDLYGDDENEFIVHLDDELPQAEKAEPQPVQETPERKTEASSEKTVQPSETRSLPARPPPQDSGGLSYSAQIAQQFSAYQQTPSQERQQRADLQQSASKGNIAGSSAIATHEGSALRTIPDRPVRPSEMKDEGKMFIGGLNWDTTDEGLRKYFSQFGKVDACTIMRDQDGKSRGFAFLTFEDPESVNAVVVHEHFLDGKTIDPKRAIPKEEHLRNTRYFVGGLAPATTAESMKEFFSAFGKVVDATVMVDRESGRSKGFGFVTFEDSNNEGQFLGKLGLVLDDKQIEVKTAQPRSQREQARSMNGSSREPYLNDRESRTPTTSNVSFIPQQQANPAASMLYQRMIGQMPMMPAVTNVGMMNPMGMGMGVGMGMGMNGFNPMGALGGMNMMGGMNPMAGMNAMGGMRMGMGGGMSGMGMMAGNMGAASMGMNNMGMRIRPGMSPMANVNPNFGRPSLNTGPGPARMSTRGQHSFHPYAR